jgi:tetratricopeptide (TPR) repeat protein
MARGEGDYLLARARYAEANEALQASVEAFDEVLSRAPGLANAYYNKGIALRLRGDLLATLSRYDEAERAYDAAVEAFDETLSRAPQDIPALYLQQGEHSLRVG